MKIELRFISGQSSDSFRGPELSQVAFERGAGGVKLSVRGKSAPGAGTFQWTAGVKALAELLLGTAQRGNHPQPYFSISGEDGSPAASLDYAISKPTSWIVDMFGRTEAGGTVAGLVIKRRNPERKLPGPVELTVAPGLSEPGAIVVFLNGERVSSPEQLASLQAELITASRDTTTRAQTSIVEALRTTVPSQIIEQLSEVMLLERSGISAACQMTGDSGVQDALLEQLPAAAVRYADKEAISASVKRLLPQRIRLAAPPTALASILIFKQLQISFGVEVELVTHFPSTTAIAEAAFDDEQSSLAVVSWGGLNRFTSRQGKPLPTPLMLLPRTTFEFQRSGSEQEVSTVLASGDPSGYPRRYFEAWRTQANRDSSDVILKDSSFAEIIHHRFKTGYGVIVASPFSALLSSREKLNSQRCDDAVLRIGDNILINDGHLVEDELRALIPCLRACWFELLENPVEVAALLQQLLEDPPFTTFIKRVSGLYAADL